MNDGRDERIRVLIVDDEEPVCVSTKKTLTRLGYAVDWLLDLERAEDWIRRRQPEILLLDVEFPGDRFGGIHLLQRLRRAGQLQPAIFLSHRNEVATVVEASRQGMVTYLEKDADEDRLLAALREAESVLPQRYDPAVPADQQMVGSSAALRDVLRQCAAFGPEVEMPVLVTGESGTGKRLVASALHEASPRRQRDLLVLNCPNIPPELADSMLFGHRKGAFTGAVADRVGFFPAADGSTLLLDEFGDLPLAIQLKLLRVLDNGEYNVLGEEQTRRTTARVIVATNQDIPAKVRSGQFRADLWHRIRGLHVHIPPLRERREDVSPLANYFVARYVSQRPDKPRVLTPEALRALERHPWPGNVRSLDMVVKALCALSETISIEGWQAELTLPEAELEADACPVRGAGERLLPVRAEDVPHWKDYKQVKEREYFERVVELAEGNVTRAAELAGVDRKKIYEVRG